MYTKQTVYNGAHIAHYITAVPHIVRAICSSRRRRNDAVFISCII